MVNHPFSSLHLPLALFLADRSQVSAWEAAAERVGQQVEALSELAESHRRSLVELKEIRKLALEDAGYRLVSGNL